MEIERLRQIEEIYHSALEFPQPERTSFIEKSCGTDLELFGEVSSLLELAERSESFLDNSPEAIAAELLDGEDEPANLLEKQLGHYKILSLLGKGGMGEVYLAEDTKLDRKVALKILPNLFASDELRMSRFIREAKTASALNHPNIITIYEIGEAANIHFIATEYIKGTTLTEHLRVNRLSVESALSLAVQIASALDEAHTAGIIHRDIKPDNVMIRESGLVKILDFGIAKLSGRGLEENTLVNSLPISRVPALHQTSAGTIIGTADYMSPEQAQGKDVDARTDIFSFGVVLYQMMSGGLPFEGKTATEIIDSILKNEPKPLSSLVPPKIAAIIDKCLKKNRDERYQTIREVLDELDDAGIDTSNQRILRTTDEIRTNRQTGGQTATGEIPASLPRRSRLPLFVAAAAVLLISLFLGYQYFAPSRQIRSIAVMPFTNESGFKDVEYLSDGMTETLINSLSNIPNLSIKARSTVFTYKDKLVPADQLGKQLNVDAVLFGRMIQIGDDLKLHLELVETSTQDVLWSASYDRKMKDLVALQIQIARDVSDKLLFKLTAAEQKQVVKSYTNSSTAHQLYLRGRFHWNKRNIKDFERAIEYFKQAIETDPKYALAYAGLADTYALKPLYGSFRPKEFMPLAKQSAQRALELDENLAEAHASLGRILNSFDYDWVNAEREFVKAIKLNPNYPTAHQWYAELLAFNGRHDEALREISTALELDPLSLTINRMKGNILSFGGKHEEAIAQLNKTAELYPDNALVRYNLGDAFAAKGSYAESVEQYLMALTLEGTKTEEIRSFNVAFRQKGWQGFWHEYLKSQIAAKNATLLSDANAYLNNESIAFAYAAVKNKPKAIEHLKLAFEERDPYLITIKMSGFYDFLRDDPEFKELVKNVGLPE